MLWQRRYSFLRRDSYRSAESVQLVGKTVIAALEVGDTLVVGREQALARRSDAITVVAESAPPPRTVARLPAISMAAPMRMSSAACMKRVSKIVSTICDAPSAAVMSAIH